jgi:enamine deaminase RidA (YjgF/YER057c/UK114 family)
MTTPTFASNEGGQPNAMIEIEFVAAFAKASETPFAGSKSAQKALLGYGAPSAMFSSGVAVKPGKALYLSSSVLPTASGDMKAQALSVLETLKSSLAAAGAGFTDVAFLRAYLVPAADGSVDRDGWNQAYMTFFNNPAQPHKPARVTIPVASLPKSDAKIAIDVIAVVP